MTNNYSCPNNCFVVRLFLPDEKLALSNESSNREQLLYKELSILRSNEQKLDQEIYKLSKKQEFVHDLPRLRSNHEFLHEHTRSSGNHEVDHDVLGSRSYEFDLDLSRSRSNQEFDHNLSRSKSNQECNQDISRLRKNQEFDQDHPKENPNDIYDAEHNFKNSNKILCAEVISSIRQYSYDAGYSLHPSNDGYDSEYRMNQTDERDHLSYELLESTQQHALKANHYQSEESGMGFRPYSGSCLPSSYFDRYYIFAITNSMYFYGQL